MPDGLQRPCAGGCGTLVHRGRCPACASLKDKARPTADARGYDRTWRVFRRRFLGLLVEAGVVPVCGAALPDGPTERGSACRDAGYLTWTSADGSSLHLDHEPPLADAERDDPAAVCDPDRIVLKCAECHGRKTGRQVDRT